MTTYLSQVVFTLRFLERKLTYLTSEKSQRQSSLPLQRKFSSYLGPISQKTITFPWLRCITFDRNLTSDFLTEIGNLAWNVGKSQIERDAEN